jgi:hypothetical protein
MLNTIEDCLETLAGLRDTNNLKIEKEEYTIINSIARQVFRGTALTDRQYELMKEKLQKYLPLFVNEGYKDAEFAIDNLRNPLRSIDRTRYVKLVDYKDNKCIAVTFPFKKTDIMLINEIKNKDTYFHEKGTHIHYFEFNEINLLDVGDRFFSKEYEVDQILLDKFKKIKDIEENKNLFLPFFENGKLKNVNSKLLGIIDNETDNEFIKVYDRRFRYGLDHLKEISDKNTLEEKIAFRDDVTYQSKPSAETLSQVLYALYNLDRYPMIVILDDKECESQLHDAVSFFRDLIPSEEQSVLFRTETKDSGFNQLIKDRNLNNWVDTDTKIVYINSNKLPKVLLETEWKPVCAFAFNSNNNKNVQMYIRNNCDLIVHREEHVSPFLRLYL